MAIQPPPDELVLLYETARVTLTAGEAPGGTAYVSRDAAITAALPKLVKLLKPDLGAHDHKNDALNYVVVDHLPKRRNE
jgi:hypothetical protein